MAFKIKRFIPASPLHVEGSGQGDGSSDPKDPKNPKPRTHAQILKAYPGAVKVPGKINTYKYKGITLKPALFPVKKKAKTVKQAIEIKEKK